MTHTPGPWKIYNAYDVVGKPGIIAATRIGTDDETVIEASCYGYNEINTTEANARLIAAAPDLLAACETILAGYDAEQDNGFDWPDVAEQLRAAIAKAKGES